MVAPGPLTVAPKSDPSQAQAPSGDIQLASSGSLHRLALLGWRIEQGT